MVSREDEQVQDMIKAKFVRRDMSEQDIKKMVCKWLNSNNLFAQELEKFINNIINKQKEVL